MLAARLLYGQDCVIPRNSWACVGNNGPRILAKRYTPRGNASGGVKKILESKKRSRLGPFPLFGEWQEGRSGPSLPQFAAIRCHRTVSPVHKLII